MGCSNGNDSDDDVSPKNPFAGKTFYGSTTINGEKYDVCELHFTSETDVTMTLYGKGEKGSDAVENLKYTVSDGKASVTYNETKITTSAIKDDTFTASLDGTDKNTCSFSTTPGKKYPTNPFAGKTFYGSQTSDKGTFDVAEIRFEDETLTMVMYGIDNDYTDLITENVPYTVADGRATMTWGGGTLTTSVITNDTFTASSDGVIISFSKTPGIKITEFDGPSGPGTPTANPFAGKTFYGSMTFDDEYVKGTFDLAEIIFGDEKLTLIMYGGGENGADLTTEDVPYTVAGGKATMTWYEFPLTTSVITNDTFTAIYGVGEDAITYSFSRTQGKRYGETILDKAGIAGIDGWDGSPLTKVDSTTYTYEFTATEEEVKFKVQKIKGSFDDGVWCAATILAKDASNENVDSPAEEVSLQFYQKDGSDAKITNLSVNSKYLLKLSIADEANNAISATVTLKEYAAPPTVYSLEGLTFKGAWTEYWSDTRILKADETQTIEITATNNGTEFGIFSPSSSNLWEGTDIPFGKETELTYKKDGGSNSTMASGFEVGKTYSVVLKVKDNSVSAPKLTITVTEKAE